MATVDSEHHLRRSSREPHRDLGPSERDAAEPRARKAHGWLYVSRGQMWILAGMLLAATGWMIFQFLLTLVTLD